MRVVSTALAPEGQRFIVLDISFCVFGLGQRINNPALPGTPCSGLTMEMVSRDPKRSGRLSRNGVNVYVVVVTGPNAGVFNPLQISLQNAYFLAIFHAFCY